jgi:hypothetical protein
MHGSRKPDNTSKAYLGTTIHSHGLLIKMTQDKIHHDYLLQITRKGIIRIGDYIKGVATESALQLCTPSGTEYSRKSSHQTLTYRHGSQRS